MAVKFQFHSQKRAQAVKQIDSSCTRSCYYQVPSLFKHPVDLFQSKLVIFQVFQVV